MGRGSEDFSLPTGVNKGREVKIFLLWVITGGFATVQVEHSYIQTDTHMDAVRVVIIYRSASSSHRPHRSQDQDLHLTVDILQPQACLVSVRSGGRLHSELVFLFSSLVPGNLGVDVDIEWVMALR